MNIRTSKIIVSCMFVIGARNKNISLRHCQTEYSRLMPTKSTQKLNFTKHNTNKNDEQPNLSKLFESSIFQVPHLDLIVPAARTKNACFWPASSTTPHPTLRYEPQIDDIKTSRDVQSQLFYHISEGQLVDCLHF